MRGKIPALIIMIGAMFFGICSLKIYANNNFINHIVINGNTVFTRKAVLSVLKLKEKEQFSATYIQEKIESLEDFYHQKGYTICKVSGYLDLKNNLIINIQEGVVEEVIFRNLNYLEVYLVRAEFGTFRNKVFHLPSIKKKLDMISSILKTSQFHYDFIPVKNTKNLFNLFLSKKSSTARGKIKEYKPYTDFYLNFRGWLLQPVPYIFITFYNLGGVDHRFRLKGDWRLDALKWFDLKFQKSIINEYYNFEYFSVPIYEDLRLNLYSGILINRTGRSDLGINFKTIRFPLQLGVGFDFNYFYSSFRVGYLYYKLRNIDFYEQKNYINYNDYLELSRESDEKYTYLSLNFSHTARKKYIKEKDNTTSLSLNYSFNSTYSWYSGSFNLEHFILYNNDIFLYRFRALYMTGNYPVYMQFALPSEFNFRGYSNIYTNRSMDGTIEHWNSIYKDMLHQIFFIDFGIFNNITYHDKLAMGNYGLSYGFGLSLSYQEMNLRIYYGLAVKQRADQGSYYWFFRRRF